MPAASSEAKVKGGRGNLVEGFFRRWGEKTFIARSETL